MADKQCFMSKLLCTQEVAFGVGEQECRYVSRFYVRIRTRLKAFFWGKQAVLVDLYRLEVLLP